MLAILFLSMPVHAVEQAEDDVSRKMIEQVQEAAAGLVSIECDFRQVKHLSMLQSEMVSEGKMYYKAGMLRWEYVAPYDYVFILSGGNAIIESSGKTEIIPVKSSRMFQQITGIMMDSVTGKCLSDGDDFSVSMHAGERCWIARLVPRKKELRQFFDCINLCIDTEERIVTSVEMIEKGGDRTVITMNNIKKNPDIDDSLFDAE